MIMFGDFNEIVTMFEKEGGAVRGSRQMDAFREMIDFCQLRDMGFRGSSFMWQGGNTPVTLVHECLDQFLANDVGVIYFRTMRCYIFQYTVLIMLQYYLRRTSRVESLGQIGYLNSRPFGYQMMIVGKLFKRLGKIV